MIKKYALEIAFILGGSVIFFSHLFGKSEPLHSKSNYFLNAPNHYINSKRDFSVGKISHIGEVSKITDVPIIQINLNEDDFFGFEKGIYTLGYNWHNHQSKLNSVWWKQNANYKQRNSEWKKKCEVLFQEKIFETEIKINGNNTRAYPQKSLRLQINKATQKYIWGDETSNWLILRNSGNDWDKTLFADVFTCKAISDLNVQTSKSKLVRVFLNNYDWGFYNACERMDEDFFAANDNVRAQDVFIVENNGVIENGGKEAEEDFENLIDAIKNKDIEKIKNQIDENNFIDYIISETFFNNIDWPSNNVLLYKIDDENSKWQFVPKDLDFGMAYSSKVAFQNDMFEFLKTKNTWLSKLFFTLIEDEDFSNNFKNRVEQLLQNELSSEVLLLKFSRFENEYTNIMPAQIQRWRYPRTIDRWKKNVQVNKLFLENREAFYKKHVAKL
ncbi:MAG: CotH kinase family protein [Bacteroidia bacterium]